MTKFFGERCNLENYVNIPDNIVLVDDRNFEHTMVEQQGTIIYSDNYQHWNSSSISQVYFPRYLLEILANPETKTYDFQQQRNYLLSCHNRNPRLHRIKLYFKLREQIWFSKCQVSFSNVSDKDSFLITDTLNELKNILTPDEIDQVLSYSKTTIAQPGDKPTDGWGYTTNFSPAHGSCYVDLVTESSTTLPLITEKTWKPLLSGQLFFILGPYGIIDHLRKTGIDVYDDIVDHSYDFEQDLDKKIEMLLNSINKIKDDLPNIWKNSTSRRLANCQLISSPEYREHLLKDVYDKINKLTILD